MKANDVFQVDNSTYDSKVMLRQTALKKIADPVVLEAYGGWGEIFNSVYGHLKDGAVIEKDSDKAEYLARQRPTWAVYEADSAAAIALGAGAHLKVNVLDVDPYGDPWPVIQGYFRSARQMADKMVVVVNDGLRWGAQMNLAHNSASLSSAVTRWGNNNIYNNYLEICRELMVESIEPSDYRMAFFNGYYCGFQNRMTHYMAVLEK